MWSLARVPPLGSRDVQTCLRRLWQRVFSERPSVRVPGAALSGAQLPRVEVKRRGGVGAAGGCG